MRRILAIAAAASLTGCLAPDPADQARDDFEDAFGELESEYGEGKADLFGFLPDPCELLAPLLEHGDAMTHAGLFVGVAGDGVLGPAVGFAGMDLVWDLYHQQFTVARYRGAGLNVGADAGAGVHGYVGAAFGFQRSVAEWYEWFVTGNLSFGLPFLEDFASVNTSLFVSGVDENGDSVIDSTEVLIPPDGVYGFQVGVRLGFDLLPDPLPVGAAVTEGYWRSYDRAILHYYDFFFERGIEVRLVDSRDGSECTPGWPYDGSGGPCVIEIGDPDDSWLWRSLDSARAICHATGSCAVPLAWPMSATAVAIGAVRSSGLEPSDLCE